MRKGTEKPKEDTEVGIAKKEGRGLREGKDSQGPIKNRLYRD